MNIFSFYFGFLLRIVLAVAVPFSSTENDNEFKIDLSHLGVQIFGMPDNETGKLVANYDPREDKFNPEELGSYLEGDMLVPGTMSRNGLTLEITRWPDGIVPFEIDGDFDVFDTRSIHDAIKEYHNRTCVKFIARTNETDYISIVSQKTGCWSGVGRFGGRQEVNLQVPGCTTKIGTIIHELMHVLGFMHEQNRSDRDSYITVNWINMYPSAVVNFIKAPAFLTDAFGVEYDFESVMHYSAYAFSRNGRRTITPKRDVYFMGQRENLSPRDVKKINRMYKCGNDDFESTRPPNYLVSALNFLGNIVRKTSQIMFGRK